MTTSRGLTPLSVDSTPTHSESDRPSSETTRRTLGTLQLAVIVFYTVSGGPFGTEEAVRSAGALFTLLGFLLLPLVWSIPEAAVTAELGSAYPEASGGVAWVEHAFGTQAGWISGFLNWVSGATDTAIYPILFLDYLLQVVSWNDVNPWIQYALVASFAMLLSYINYRGLDIVGGISSVICAVSMSPFILVVLIGVWKVQPRRWLQLPEDSSGGSSSVAGAVLRGVLWRPFLNNIFWNLNSFDSASSFSGEVTTGSYPRAMFWSVLLVISGYFVPLLIVLGASDASQSAWEDGYLATAISEVAGPWLGDWTVFAAGISNIALFQAEMSSDAYQVMGMAERGYLPKIFSTRSRHGTPTFGILLGLVVVLAMSVGDLADIIEMLNFNYAISLLMEYAAFIKLRISKPEVPRPYRIPLSTFGCILMLTPTFGATLLVMALASFHTIVVAFVSVAVALLSFHLRQRGRECCRYTSVPEGEGEPPEDDTPRLHESDVPPQGNQGTIATILLPVPIV